MTVLPVYAPAGTVAPEGLSDRVVTRRIGIIWGLLLFNGLGSLPGGLLPRPLAQAMTMGALALASVLVLTLNRRLLVKPNSVLVLATVLATTSLMTGVRGVAGTGAILRSGRLLVFLAVLWLLTPWWDRRDLLLARCHVRALAAVCAVVALGIVVSPGRAFGGGGGRRLTGVLWSIPPPQVAEYAAILSGMVIVLWLSGRMARVSAFLLGTGGMVMVLSTRTRTSSIALVVGVAVGGLTLILWRKRVRRIAKIALVVLPIAVVLFAPAVTNWFQRDQSATEITGLTGRKHVWNQVTSAPRPGFNRLFGFGLSDKSFGGLPIDSTWLAVYQDQGLFGDALVAAMLLGLLGAAAQAPPGHERALATFTVVYIIIASYTEVGLGDASPYLLHAVVAASLVSGAAARRRGPEAAPT